jgi:hypothetical protein
MSLVRTKPLADCASPQEALAELCAGFTRTQNLVFDCEEITPEEMPQPFRQLLVHDRHMTRTLVAYYKSPLDLHVQEMHKVGNLYSRKIFLCPSETKGVVEHGLVRLDLKYMPELVKREILQEHAPLGAIMINHDIHQRIQARWYLRFPPDSSLLQWVDCQIPGPLYGRLGTIYCDDEPVIEVLEIVTGIPEKP